MTKDEWNPVVGTNLLGTRRMALLAASVIAVAALTVYANSFSGEFVFDDLPWIVMNPTIRKLWPLSEVLFPPNQGFASGRPVLNLTLAVNYAFAGTDPRSYHAVNIAIHILAGLTLFGIVRRTLAMPVLRDRFAAFATPLALAVVLVWVVHPVQTAAVSYVIQRTESLVSLFYLLTLYCVIRGATSIRPTRWYLSAAAACLLGMGTKEVMATAPIVVLLYDRTFLSGSFWNALRMRWGMYLAMAATWGVVVWCLISTGLHAGSAGFGSFGDSQSAALSYALTQPGVIVHYLQLTFWPVGLCLDYGWPAAKSLDEILPPALLVTALVGLTVWALVKNPPLGFLGASFFLILAPTSSFVPIKDAAFDHRMYLPLAAMVALVVIGGFAIWDRLMARGQDAETGANSPRRWLVPICALAAAVVSLGWGTIRRNENFSSGEAIWLDVVDQFPNNARAHNNLAVQLVDRGKLDEAIVHCRRALDLTPGYADAENNLGLALDRQGKLDTAIQHYQEALRIRPQHVLALDNLANALIKKEQTAEAIDLYDRILKIEPENAKAHYGLANCFRDQNNPAAAIQHYERAIEFNPEYVEAHNNLAGILGQQGRFDEAIQHFEQALKLKSDHADAHYNLGMIFYSQAKIARAESHWREAVRLQPQQVQYLRTLALALAVSPDPSTRNGTEAVALAQRAIELSEKPDPEVIATLAAAYAQSGQFPKAVETARQALQLAITEHKDDLVNQLSDRIKLYESGRPYRELRK